MNRFVEIQRQILLSFNCWGKALLPLLHLLRRFLCSKFVVNDLEGSSLLDSSVCGRAVWTVDNLSCHRIHGFG